MTARRAVACRLSEEHVAALERVRVEQSLPLLSDAVRVVIERGLAGACFDDSPRRRPRRRPRRPRRST